MKDFEHEELLNNVILKYEWQLIKIALSYVKDIYAAEDIVQQVWIKYYVRLMERGANSEQSTYAWLYRVTVNQSLDFLRRYYNRNVTCMDKIEILAHVQRDSIRYYEEDELGVWDREDIYQWIHSLPLKYSEAMISVVSFKPSAFKASELVVYPINNFKADKHMYTQILKIAPLSPIFKSLYLCSMFFPPRLLLYYPNKASSCGSIATFLRFSIKLILCK